MLLFSILPGEEPKKDGSDPGQAEVVLRPRGFWDDTVPNTITAALPSLMKVWRLMIQRERPFYGPTLHALHGPTLHREVSGPAAWCRYPCFHGSLIRANIKLLPNLHSGSNHLSHFRAGLYFEGRVSGLLRRTQGTCTLSPRPVPLSSRYAPSLLPCNESHRVKAFFFSSRPFFSP